MNLTNTRIKVDKMLGELKSTQTQLKNERAILIESEDHLAHIEEAQDIVQQVAQLIQQQAHNQIAAVVTRCLVTVFEDDYGFEIHFEKKRGRTEANLILTKDGNEIENPLNSDSGGVVDIAAFALRLSCLVLAKPRQRRFLAMDEPFKFVSAEYRENVKMLLEGLAEDFDLQIIMVTHVQELVCGKIIRL